MKTEYTYEFCNESITIEVEENELALLKELDRMEYNNDHTETRRHKSLNAIADNGGQIDSHGQVIDLIFCDMAKPYQANCDDVQDLLVYKEICERLQKFISRLTPEQQTLIQTIFFEEVNPSDFAKQEGVGKSAISHRLERAIKQLKKYFD
jgi:RNA polymerase sigma-70 factor (ECF subfamily)